MAASRKTFQRANRTGRANAIQKARQSVTWAPVQSTRNRPVRKALRKPRRPAGKVQRNKSAIYTLSRQVQQLKNRSQGELQRNIQFCFLEGATLPTAASPVAFMLEDLYNNAHFYKGTVTGGGGNGVPGFAENALWQDVPDQTDLNPMYNLMNREIDGVSDTVFRAISTKISFNFRVSAHGAWPAPGCIRITVLRMKPWLATSKLSVNLPGTLGSFRFLAQESADRGYFNRDYMTVLMDKWIPFKFPVQTTTAGTDCNDIYKTVSIPWRFGPHGKTLRPDFSGDPAQRMWTNIPETQQTWMLISVGSNLDGKLAKIEAGRVNQWRDPVGTT